MNTEVNNTVLLVGINLGNDEIFQYEMEEMENLCQSLNLYVVETIYQNLNVPFASTYVGTGKLDEIRRVSNELNVDFIVFNDELSPIQYKNISNALSKDVIDRTMLILQIFKQRAKTKEAILQVELAEMKFQLPRLAGSYERLSRLGGGAGGGRGARRGAGETALELDRRHIENRIIKLKNELNEICQARATARKARINSLPIVSLVGYTNVGKSTTLNTILSYFSSENIKEVFSCNMLFATLETRSRSLKLPNNKEFILTDTVGFVSKLPHHLIESFKSTLEEISESTLIIHVVDCSSPFLDLQIETTNRVLSSLGVTNVPVLYLFNKIDLVPNRSFVVKNYTPNISFSNLTKEGLEALITYIEKTIFPEFEINNYLIPYDKGEIYHQMKTKGEVLETTYSNEGIIVKASLSKHLTSLFSQYIVK